MIVAGEEVCDLHVDGKVYDVIAWSSPERPARRAEHPRPAPGHARRRPRAPGRRRRRAHRLDPEPDLARGQLAPHRRRHEREGPRPGLGGARRRTSGSAKLRFPREYHAEVLGEFAERQAAAGPAAGLRDRGRDRDLPAAADVHRQLAGGGVLVPDAAARARRRRARRVRGGRADLARLAGRVPDGVRDRRPQRHPAHQPLPAPRARGGSSRSASSSCCGARASGWRRS